MVAVVAVEVRIVVLVLVVVSAMAGTAVGSALVVLVVIVTAVAVGSWFSWVVVAVGVVVAVVLVLIMSLMVAMVAADERCDPEDLEVSAISGSHCIGVGAEHILPKYEIQPGFEGIYAYFYNRLMYPVSCLLFLHQLAQSSPWSQDRPQSLLDGKNTQGKNTNTPGVEHGMLLYTRYRCVGGGVRSKVASKPAVFLFFVLPIFFL